MLDLSLIAAFAAIIVTAAALLVDAWQTRSIGKINKKVEAFQQQDIGASFGEWLLAKGKTDDGKEISNLESMAALVGHQMFTAAKMSIQGFASGEARQIRSVESKLMAAFQPEEAKAFNEVLARAGIPEEFGSIAYKIMEQKGWLSQIIKNDGQGSGESRSW